MSGLFATGVRGGGSNAPIMGCTLHYGFAIALVIAFVAIVAMHSI